MSATTTDDIIRTLNSPRPTRTRLEELYEPVDDETEADRAAAEMKTMAIDPPKRSLPMESNVLGKKDPLPSARKFVAERFTLKNGDRTLVHRADTFFRWDGHAYAELKQSDMKAEIYPWLERHGRFGKSRDGGQEILPFQPTRADVDEVIAAQRSVVNTTADAPCWLRGGEQLPDPRHLIVAANGIVDISSETATVLPPTPNLFTLHALDYDYNPKAPEPVWWLKFLDVLWPDDPESIQLLQEWAGYILTLDTKQQKILLLVGPPRSGKGTIARVFTRMVGRANACAPTLSGLASHFGLWSLLGKQLAVISDARLSGRVDQAIITERLLTISGEDSIEVERKNLSSVTVRLPTRIMICTNEIPKLADSSGALPSRFIPLPLEQSFLGREDHDLEGRLMGEMPGILNWAIEGWHRLRARGRFQQPVVGQAVMDEMRDLSSPVSVFLRECCVVKPGIDVAIQDAFDAYTEWSGSQGQKHPGTVQTLGRDLRAVVPGLSTGQRRIDGDVKRTFKGLNLTLIGEELASRGRTKRGAHE